MLKLKLKEVQNEAMENSKKADAAVKALMSAISSRKQILTKLAKFNKQVKGGEEEIKSFLQDDTEAVLQTQKVQSFIQKTKTLP